MGMAKNPPHHCGSAGQDNLWSSFVRLGWRKSLLTPNPPDKPKNVSYGVPCGIELLLQSHSDASRHPVFPFVFKPVPRSGSARGSLWNHGPWQVITYGLHRVLLGCGGHSANKVPSLVSLARIKRFGVDGDDFVHHSDHFGGIFRRADHRVTGHMR